MSGVARGAAVSAGWLAWALTLGAAGRAGSGEQAATAPPYEKIVLSEEFLGEGAALGDLNGDGHADAVAGPYWYPGPEFRQRRTYAAPRREHVRQYSQHFFAWTHDVNGDGRLDIVSVGFPGDASCWFENPGDDRESWSRHVVARETGNESPAFADLDGDGRPELICAQGSRFGSLHPGDDPRAPWRFRAVTGDLPSRINGHGLGVGDVNGDGRLDLLETRGWWEQGADPAAEFRFHETQFASRGGCQMFAYDFDGDGDNDVVSVQQAHGRGLTWFERRGSGDDYALVPHPIFSEQGPQSPDELSVSQMHALGMADIDGDGVLDLVTGKRFYAHAEGDAGIPELPALYCLRTARQAGSVGFEPLLLDLRSGVGTQLAIGEVNGDGRPDILVGNKLGAFVVRSVPATSAAEQRFAPYDLPRLQRAGTTEFDQLVRSTEPLTAEQQQRTFLLPEGFSIQLFASEPDIAKPMNMAFDARGRLWVASSEEYPFAAPPDRTAADAIVVLEDVDGDGRADRSTRFAEGLNIPIGLYPYGDGVVCFSIPDILYLRDTDGDGRADRREKLYGPFDCSRDTHGMCNAFTRGLDGWLYACHGFNNRSEVAGRDGNLVTMHSGNVFRFRLDGSRIEHFAHGQVNPFGMKCNSWGDLFTADCHSKPISLILQGGYHDSFGKPHDGLGYVPDVMSHLHGSTGIGGLALGEDAAFPAVYRDSVFLGNVVTSRVNRSRLVRSGASYVALEEPDFVISGDPWFRPVDLQMGPDGCLYVADFYNRIIGHYEVDLRHPGRDRRRGRIWRIAFTNSARRRDDPGSPAPRQRDLDSAPADAGALLAGLTAGGPAYRSQVVDRVADGIGPAAVPAAAEALRHASADVRVGALWVLFRLNALSDALWDSALRDDDPLVRRHALRAVQADADPPAAASQWIARACRDPDPRVRLGAAMAAAHCTRDSLVAPLVALRRGADANDGQLSHAAALAIRNHLREPGRFAAWAAQMTEADASWADRVCLGLPGTEAGDWLASGNAVSRAAAAERPAVMHFIARHASPAALSGLVQALDADPSLPPAEWAPLVVAATEGYRGRGDWSASPLAGWARTVVGRLLAAAEPSGASAEESGRRETLLLAAADLAARCTLRDFRGEFARRLADPAVAPTTALGLARALAATSPAGVPPTLAEIPTLGGAAPDLVADCYQALAADDAGSAPDLIGRAMHVATSAEQQRLAASLCGEAGGTDLLLATLTAGKASPQLLHDAQIRERLAAVASPRQWAAIEQWLREAPPAAEQGERLVEARQAAFQERPGDPAQGKAVFRQHCAACHRVAGEGQQVGPNLDGMASRGAARIVEDVLLPHRNVDAAFRATIVTTHSGKVLTGLVRGEPGPDGLLLVDSQGRETLVPHDDLAELKLSGLSPMPGNFGEVLPPHEFNDLLAYLLALRN